jgi:hypothetical protein
VSTILLPLLRRKEARICLVLVLEVDRVLVLVQVQGVGLVLGLVLGQ